MFRAVKLTLLLVLVLDLFAQMFFEETVVVAGMPLWSGSLPDDVATQ